MQRNMSLGRLSYHTALVLLGAALFFTGCKKDTKTLTLVGIPSYDIDKYIAQGEEITLFPKEVYLAKGDRQDKVIKEYYRINKRGANSDTVSQSTVLKNGIHITMPTGDTIGNTTMAVYAIAEGYTSSSASRNITIVAPDFIKGSLTQTGIKEGDPGFTDTDGRKYYTVKIAGKTWMKQNYAGGKVGRPYYDSKAMLMLFGKYYTWNEAQNVCPAGWHLSSDSEWQEMLDTYGTQAGAYMVNAVFNLEEKLWPYWPEVKITNASGLSALSTGYGYQKTDDSYSFINYGNYCMFWTAGEKDGMGHFKYINVKTVGIMDGYTGKDDVIASVRCVQDPEN